MNNPLRNMNMKMNSAQAWPMRDIEYPHENDVVCGRGGMANNHPGNIAFRDLVNQYKVQYIKSSRHQKTQLAEDLVLQWQITNAPGRFVKLNDATGMYDDVGKKKARGKTSQLLREDAPTIRKRENIHEAWDDEDYDNYESHKSSDNLPPPPPPPPQDLNETPPMPLQRRKSSKDLKVPSPNSVTMMIDDVMLDRQPNQPQQQPQQQRLYNSHAFNGVLHPDRNDSICDQFALDCKVPALPIRNNKMTSTKEQFQAIASPLDAFLKGMLQERAADNNTGGIAILQDNATAPSQPKSRDVAMDSTHTNARGPSFFPTDASVADDDFSALSWSRHGSIHGSSHHGVPEPRRFSGSRRVNTQEVVAMEILVRPRNLSESEHSSLRDIGLDLLDNDPLLQLPMNSVHKEHRGSSANEDTMSLDTSDFSRQHRKSVLSADSTMCKDLLSELEAMSVVSMATSSGSSGHCRVHHHQQQQQHFGMDALSTHSTGSMLQVAEFADDLDESTNTGGVGESSLREIFLAFA